MISYLLKSASCLALLLFFYHWVLEKEKMHAFNRFYLLFGVLVSLLIPFATLTVAAAPETFSDAETYSTIDTVAEQAFVMEDNTGPFFIEETVNYRMYFIGFYVFISLILSIKFGRNLFKIIQKIYVNKKVKFENATLVLVDDKILPHTFWNAIFINKNDYKNGKIEPELFTHELTHVTQKHTIDVLLIELFQIVFWINPLFIFLKKAVQLNHEFLADETVIKEHKNTFQYQHLILNKAAWNNTYYLASNLNYSLTKKRLLMMTTQSSRTIIWLKKLAVMPLLAGFIFLFAERVEAQEKEEIIEEMPYQKNKLSESEIYKEYVNRNLTITYKDKNGKKISKRYSELTKEEKKKVIPPPPLKLKKKAPTKQQFDALKQKSNYAVWIDGKVVKNEVLDNYKHTDFVRYSNSFVYKNARSKRFPQKNQATLETQAYFENQNEQRVKRFKEYLEKEYEVEEIKINETSEKPSFIFPISQKFNPEISSNFEIRMHPILKIRKMHKGIDIVASEKASILSAEKGKVIDISEKNIQYGKFVMIEHKNGFRSFYAHMSSINVTTGQTLKKGEKIGIIGSTGRSLNTHLHFEIIKNNKKVNPLEYVKTTTLKGNSKKDLELTKTNFYNKSENAIYKYQKLNKIYESKRNEKPHFVKSDVKRQNELQELFSDLGSLYYKLSKEDKKKVKRPILPQDPYLRLMKNNKVFYKLKNELTQEDELLIPPPPPAPNASKEQILKAKAALKAWKKTTGNDFVIPPPPPPKNHLDHVIEMAKKGAKFYYEKKPISSDKAIELLKKNKKLNIHSESTNYTNYKVWISKEHIKTDK